MRRNQEKPRKSEEREDIEQEKRDEWREEFNNNQDKYLLWKVRKVGVDMGELDGTIRSSTRQEIQEATKETYETNVKAIADIDYLEFEEKVSSYEYEIVGNAVAYAHTA